MRDVDGKPMLERGRASSAALARGRARARPTLDDLRGGTFTVTNIGALGGTGAIPIINYPGGRDPRRRPRARRSRSSGTAQIVPRLLLPLSLTFDHRVIDGVDGARFSTEIVGLLEAPERLFLEG